eukprot:TRINITY_DN19779_c0_g1_i1.p2 TRINITY_DN19779_c0_g1~~TRINITY_DN19779_c0_g1_i1.p2  ORF type:complete len:290 (-),score=38.45 TRINITY_DN19779_c0_g1_i1:362-1231(-)
MEQILAEIKKVGDKVDAVQAGIKASIHEELLPVKKEISDTNSRITNLESRIEHLEKDRVQPVAKRPSLASSTAPPSVYSSSMGSDVAGGSSFSPSFKAARSHICHFRGDERITASQAKSIVQREFDRISVPDKGWYFQSPKSTNNQFTIVCRTPCGPFDGPEAVRELRKLAHDPNTNTFSKITFLRDMDTKPCSYSVWSDLDSSTIYKKYIFAAIRSLISALPCSSQLTIVNRDCEISCGYDLVVAVDVRYGSLQYALRWGDESTTARLGIIRPPVESAAAAQAAKWRL